MDRHDPAHVPVTVNLHVTRACNYRCGFCFATFPGLRDQPSPDGWSSLLRLLSETPLLQERYIIDKITFAGGEPTLVAYLPQLVRETRRLGFVTSLVTNGTGLTDSFLAACGADLDWVALSIESANDDVNRRLGRGDGRHVETVRSAVERLRRLTDAQLKLNTVVTSLNWREDLHDLIGQIDPVRWKVFQATRLDDQNGVTIAGLEVSPEQFEAFCERHRDLDPVCETEDQMKGSYLMVAPSLRFFGSATGHHVYSEPILDVGVAEAVRQVGWCPAAFLERGGAYEWRPLSRRKP